MKVILDFVTNSSEADYYDCDYECDCNDCDCYDCNCDCNYDCDCDDCDCVDWGDCGDGWECNECYDW